MKTVPVKCFELIEQPPEDEEEEEVAKKLASNESNKHRQTNSNNNKKIKPNAHTDNNKKSIGFHFLSYLIKCWHKKSVAEN